MSNAFTTFRKFNDIELATQIAARLEEGHIEYLLEDNHKIFDPNFANNTIEPDISIKLKPKDFLQANKLLEEYYSKSLGTVDKDYYLLSFTDEELMELVAKPDEWGPFDYQLAQKLLKERGKEIGPGQVELFKKQRIAELSQPEHIRKYWIVAGYFIAIFFAFFGIIIGWIMAYLKKTLPDGQRVYTFGETERNHGKNIMLLGFVSLMLWFVLNSIFGVLDFMMHIRF